jgi:flavin reductase (DIM6/NTAB) family NADH-FMN oxidoreductase RutF
LLGDDQSDLSTRFARGGADKWRTVAPLRGPKGQPVIPGGLASFECETYARYDGGDHKILVGRVVSLQSVPGEPLVFYGGRHRRIQPDQPIATPADADIWLHGW